jgi:ABC-type branched-subunit amino acid transport system ATPase component
MSSDGSTPEPADAPTFGFGLAAVEFSDGTSVPLPESGVLLLVGPNNAGKSATLRDLVALITVPLHNRQPTRVVTRVEVAREGTVEDFQAWLQANAFSVERPDGAGNKVLHLPAP